MINRLITNLFVTPVGRKKHPMNTGAITSTRRISDVDIGRDTRAKGVAFIIERNLNETTTYH